MTALAQTTRVALGTGGLATQVPLLLHIAGGTIGIVTGFVALCVAKGGTTHRRSGILFVYAMLAMSLVGAAIAMYEGKIGSVDGGLLTAYLVVTALLSVRTPTDATRRMELAAMLVAIAVGSINVALGTASAVAGARARDGVPVPAYFVFGGIALMASAGDARMMRLGGLRGTARLARHLWRMCFALFIAAGSFFLGQAKVIPQPIRIVPLLAVPPLLALAALAYWMWRVRIRRSLRNLVQAGAPDTIRTIRPIAR